MFKDFKRNNQATMLFLRSLVLSPNPIWPPDSKTHQLSSSSQCKEKISQSGCAPARGSFHEGFTHLASFSSDFDSQKLTVSKENSDWIENKAKQIIAVVATSQNFFLFIWNRRGGRLINARTGKIWHPKV